MKQYTFTLKAKEPQSYGIVGTYVQLFTALGDITISTDNGDHIVLVNQTGWKADDIFKTLTFLSEIDQTVTFYAGFGGFTDQRTVIITAVDTASGDDNRGGVLLVPEDRAIITIPAKINRAKLTIYGANNNGGLIYVSPYNFPFAQTAWSVLASGDIMEIVQGAKLSWYVATPTYAVAGLQCYYGEILT